MPDLWILLQDLHLMDSVVGGFLLLFVWCLFVYLFVGGRGCLCAVGFSVLYIFIIIACNVRDLL